ncbi:uncharacterized protein LOC113331243 [Papaver somniferum]|uniref:uncharacterized protein LOC113331243 n=1 Tax=Papaver somniferum TaxID=3469 RepID=UPI000E6F947D|nr:uncharacterized protein LOC113331243 [Papaver somniferum]
MCSHNDEEIATLTELLEENVVSSSNPNNIDNYSLIQKDEDLTRDTIVLDGVVYYCDYEADDGLEERFYSETNVLESRDSETIAIAEDYRNVQPHDYNLEEIKGHFPKSKNLEIKEIVTSLSKDMDNSKFGGEYHFPRRLPLTLTKVPNLGLNVCASTILRDYLHARFSEPKFVQKETQLIETHPLVDVVKPGHDTIIDFVVPPKFYFPNVGVSQFEMCHYKVFRTKSNYFGKLKLSTHFLKNDHYHYGQGQLCKSNPIDLEDPLLFRLLLCASKFLFEFVQTLQPDPPDPINEET